jgi:hypothetical protein
VSKYTPIDVRGNYSARQAEANRLGAVAYIDCHYNAAANQNANYSSVVVADNASQTSKAWGTWFAREVARRFQIPMRQPDGLWIGGYQGRGNGNLVHTKMPATLIEPWFISNPQGAMWAKSPEYQSMLADVIVDSIVQFFPDGGIVCFSLGHKYRDSMPNDRGAPAHGGGTEADLMEPVMNLAMHRLGKIEAKPAPTPIPVAKQPHIKPVTPKPDDVSTEPERNPKPWSK